MSNFIKDKICQNCGSSYQGTASSKYCLDCKDSIIDSRNKGGIKCPKCNTPYEIGKQFCQGDNCGFNMAYWIKTGMEYQPGKASCLPFTKGF